MPPEPDGSGQFSLDYQLGSTESAREPVLDRLVQGVHLGLALSWRHVPGQWTVQGIERQMKLRSFRPFVPVVADAPLVDCPAGSDSQQWWPRAGPDARQSTGAAGADDGSGTVALGQPWSWWETATQGGNS